MLQLQSWSKENVGTCWPFCLAASPLSSGRAAEERKRVRKRGGGGGGCVRIEYRADKEEGREIGRC